MAKSDKGQWVKRRTALWLVSISFLLGCRKGEEKMVFEHPHNVGLGRLRLTVPGPGTEVKFDSSQFNGIDLGWMTLPRGQSLSSAWQPQLAELSSDGHLDKLIENSETRKSAISHVSVKRDSYEITEWRRVGDEVLKAHCVAAPNTVELAQRDIEAVFSHFHVTTGAPAAGMFYVDGGGLQMPPNLIEQVRAHVKIPFGSGNPDQWIDVTTFTVNSAGTDDVLARHAQLRAPLLAHGIVLHSLRAGDRTVAGMPGHEAVIWTTSDRPGAYSFSAEFAFGGSADSSRQPNTSIIFSSTDFAQSIKPEHLLALWDTVLDSMRMETSE